ncbi:MAG: hypothetical protein ACTH1Z_07405 [Ancrocorticia sp.]|uniref:hypothetical protein n=2 Tax=Ancrocorticia sp. TaxID=2593684 RepID=UPI003F922016
MIVRITCFTAHRDGWIQLVTALGGTLVTETELWHLYALGAGRIGIHDVPAESPVAGKCAITLEVPDLESYLATTSTEAADLSIGDTRHGRAITVTSQVLPTFFIDQQEGEVAHSGKTIAAPLFLTRRVPEGAQLLADLGMTPRLSSQSDSWADLTADGVAAVHDGDSGFMMGLEHPDLDQLETELRDAGIRTTPIDERYGRTLRVAHPDNPSTDAEIWISETQTDLYGYREGLPQ